MRPWELSNREWERLAPILRQRETEHRGPGRRRADDRAAAQACLYRYFHSRARCYRAFGWNELPATLGVSPATANRRFREWNASGAWPRFWDRLFKLRPQFAKPTKLKSPVRSIITELERAFSLFNARFFGNALPSNVVITLEGSMRSEGSYRTRGGAHHVAISTRALNRGAEMILGVLLHEMVHMRNHVFHLPDVRRGYHNRHFRDTAMLAGLECSGYNTSRGYAQTRLDARGLRAVAAFGARDVFVWPTGGSSGVRIRKPG